MRRQREKAEQRNWEHLIQFIQCYCVNDWLCKIVREFSSLLNINNNIKFCCFIERSRRTVAPVFISRSFLPSTFFSPLWFRRSVCGTRRTSQRSQVIVQTIRLGRLWHHFSAVYLSAADATVCIAEENIRRWTLIPQAASGKQQLILNSSGVISINWNYL